jgi:ABC-2 type transport system permease protein
MTGFAVVVRKELLEQWRTFRLPIVTGLFLIVGIGSPLLAKYTPQLVTALAGDIGIPIPPPRMSDAVDQILKNIAQFGSITAILLAMGSVATEKDRGTAALLLTKPLDRTAFLVAKIAAIATTLLVATVLAVAAGWIYTAILFEAPSVAGFAWLALFTWLSLVAYAVITFLFSTLTRSAMAAAGIGIIVLLVLGILSAFPRVAEYLPPGLATPARALALGEPADVLVPVVSTLVLIGACFTLAWASFRRQEL